MPFAVEIPDGWHAVRNPNYPQDNQFEDAVRRATISEALGVDAFFSPLAEDGRLKVRYVLFDEAKWNGPDSCESWVRDNRDALKWHLPEGRPHVFAREKTVEVAVLKDFGPTPRESDMERINALALRELTPEEVYVRPMHLANTRVDRAFERFVEKNIRQFSKSIVGKSTMVAHNYGTAPVGRFYDSTTEKTDGVVHLKPFFYIVRAAPSAAEAIPQIDGGVWKDVSVGYNYEAMQCDLCLGDYLDYNACAHIAGEAYPKEDFVEGDRGGFEVLRDGKWFIDTANYSPGDVEGLEGSLGVWLGCQYDAEVVKAHRKLYGDPHEAKRAEAERRGWVAGKKVVSLPSVRAEPVPDEAPPSPIVATFTFPLSADAPPVENPVAPAQEGTAMPDETKATHIGTPSRLPTMPEDTPWNPQGVTEARIINTILGIWERDENTEPSWASYKRVNVWWQDPGDKLSDFKLKVGRREPIENDGTLKLNWRQVASRMAILNGAREGVDIPSEDREKCYRELARCYKRFDKPLPELASSVSPAEAKFEDWIWHNDEPRILEEERLEYSAGGAPADDAAGKDGTMAIDAKELEAEHEATKATLDETKAALAEAQAAVESVADRLKTAEAERDAALAATKPLRAKIEEEVAWYAQQLKLDDTLAALAGEPGLAGLTPEKLLELRESWRGKHEATLPGRIQSEHEIGKPEADPEGGAEDEPITDVRTLRAARM